VALNISTHMKLDTLSLIFISAEVYIIHRNKLQKKVVESIMCPNKSQKVNCFPPRTIEYF
jgi:hypothetical protein